MRRAHSSRSCVRFFRRWLTSSRNNETVDSASGGISLTGETPLPLSSFLFTFWSPMGTSYIHHGDPSLHPCDCTDQPTATRPLVLGLLKSQPSICLDFVPLIQVTYGEQS